MITGRWGTSTAGPNGGPETCLAVMPGIPQGRSIRERGRGSATLVQIGADGVQATEVPLALLAFDERRVDLGDSASQTDSLETLTRAVRDSARDDCMVALRLRLANAGRLGGDAAYAKALAQEIAEAAQGVFIEAVRPETGTSPATPGVVADLAAMMADEAGTPGFRDEAAAMLAEWQAALPRDIAGALAPEELDELVATGLNAVIGRLAGEADRE